MLLYENMTELEKALKYVDRWNSEEKWKEVSFSKFFLYEMFQVLGLDMLEHARAEYAIKDIKKKIVKGRLDLYKPNVYLFETKSGNVKLEKADKQIEEYITIFKENKIPVPDYFVSCNFREFKIDDRIKNIITIFPLEEFVDYRYVWDFLYPDYVDNKLVNKIVPKKVALNLGSVCNQLRDLNIKEEILGINLKRLIFCHFLDTAILQPGTLLRIISSSKDDGSDLGMILNKMYGVLNTPVEEREKNLDKLYSFLPYVGGSIFTDNIGSFTYTKDMRNCLANTASYNWTKCISPMIIGNIYQESMTAYQRRDHGIHYTSKKNIYKIVDPIIIRYYEQEIEKNKTNISRLKQLHKEIANLYILDPSCGSGNFLVAVFKRLSDLELTILKYIYSDISSLSFELEDIKKVSINQFRGIEIDKVSAELAEMALITADMEVNRNLLYYFKKEFTDLPLSGDKRITIGNALEINWHDLLPSKKYFDYIIGNPPYHGGNKITAEQLATIKYIYHDTKGAVRMDYSTCWLVKFAEYVQGCPKDHKVSGGFVLPAPIIYGERGEYLWNFINKYTPIHINFAHQPFRWKNGAKNIADVMVIILGISNIENQDKYLYKYTFNQEPITEIKVDNITPLLTHTSISNLKKINIPINSTTKQVKGGISLGPDNLFKFTNDEKIDLCKRYPVLEENNYFTEFLTGMSFAKGYKSWCIDMKDCQPIILKDMPEIEERINKIKTIRANTKNRKVNRLANLPLVFIDEEFRFDNQFMVLPKIFSIYYRHVPIGIFDSSVIPSKSFLIIENPSLYDYAILSSRMFNIWCDSFVSGRGGSSGLTVNVYNNFPWPEVNQDQKQQITNAGKELKGIIDKYLSGENYVFSTLYNFEQYIPPVDLQKAFNNLDILIESIYQKNGFTSDDDRINFLYVLNQYSFQKDDNSELKFS